MKRIFTILMTAFCLTLSLTGCNSNPVGKKTTITLAAAASLKNCMDNELIPMFEEQYPHIKIQTTYDASGKLQSQIEEGAPIDVFMSAAMKQMDSLKEKGLIHEDSMVQLLENKVVLIVPENNPKGLNAFEDILDSDSIAIGDPESVPAGQYAKEALTNLDIWDKVSHKLSLGTNVTEVLNWIAEGSGNAGIVYSTDASSNPKVKIVCEAPEGTVSKVIYPVGIVKNSQNEDTAKSFITFLQTDEAMKIFESYGFTPNK